MADTQRSRDDDAGEAEPMRRPGSVPRAVARLRPPGFGRSRAWRSPLRGPWLTSVFSLGLLIGLPIVALTGLLSYVAYGPRFGQAHPVDVGWLHLPLFDWPTRPAWIYRLTQGVHVIGGPMLVPLVLAKLWSVLPKLFAWPPVRSIAHALERLSLIGLVGGILFELATGVLNIQYDYVFGFSFYTAHYYGAWVFIAALVVHLALKLSAMVRALRSRSLRTELRTSRADTGPEPVDDELVAVAPGPPTLGRRGALGLVAGGVAMVGVLSAGQTIGGAARKAALLLPRGRSAGDRPGDFQVNKTAVAAGVDPARTGTNWRLRLTGARSRSLDRAVLLGMPQHTAELPIACVEGWSTTRRWTGVRLRDLAALAGVPDPAYAHVASLQRHGAFRAAYLQADQVLDPDALLALRVDGVDLPLDHGFPARVIVPGLPGVHNTKWVASIEFGRHA